MDFGGARTTRRDALEGLLLELEPLQLDFAPLPAQHGLLEVLAGGGGLHGVQSFFGPVIRSCDHSVKPYARSGRSAPA